MLPYFSIIEGFYGGTLTLYYTWNVRWLPFLIIQILSVKKAKKK